MKRFAVWFPALMVLFCVAFGIISIVREDWINLITFATVGASFGLQLHSELMHRRRS